MKVKYDIENDIVYICLTESPVAESDENKHGVIIDYAEDGSIVGIEILHASKKQIHPEKIEYIAA